MDSKRLQMIKMLHKIASVKNESECMVNCGYLFVNPWTVARQAPLSMGFPRQEYWSGLPFSTPGDLPDPGIKPCVSCNGRQILYHWATWEPKFSESNLNPKSLEKLPSFWNKKYIFYQFCLCSSFPWSTLISWISRLLSTSLLCPWDFPGKNIGVGCHFLLQRIFPTQRPNPNLLHWQADSLPLSHQGSPSHNLLIKHAIIYLFFPKDINKSIHTLEHINR